MDQPANRIIINGYAFLSEVRRMQPDAMAVISHLVNAPHYTMNVHVALAGDCPECGGYFTCRCPCPSTWWGWWRA